MEKFFKTKDGIHLRYKENYVSSKVIVVIVHGFAEHLGRYDYLTKRLNDNGISVFRYDARGHGLSSGKMGHMDSYKDMIDDLFEIIKFIKNNEDFTKILTLGHSMGGNITANFGINFPNLINGQLFSGGAFGYISGMNSFKKYSLALLKPLFKNIYMTNPVKIISSDSQVIIDYENDPLVLKKATLSFYYEFTVKGTENIFNNTSKYYYPCFIGHGNIDKIVSKEASKRFYNEISSEQKYLKIYDSLHHEIFNEPTKDKVINDYINWINKNI